MIKQVAGPAQPATVAEPGGATGVAEAPAFLIAHGGPFYHALERMQLMRARRSGIERRVLLFVGLAWAGPLVLAALGGDLRSYLTDPATWGRFFVAVGLFVHMERVVEDRLQVYLRQLVRAPLLAPSAFPAAAASVETALRRLDSFRAEAVILLSAVLIALVPAVMRSGALADRTWAIDPAQGLALTPAGWYATVISSSLLWFLLLRWLWRHLVWSLLLRSLARLDLRLVATHPDRNGGLAFIGQYPNAFALLVLGMSSIVGAALANGLSAGEVTPTIFGWVMTLWLAIILALFAFPLSAFSRPLHKLKEETQLACSSAATRWHRANEREVLGRNIVASADAADTDKGQLQNPSAFYADVGRLSTVLLKRSAVVPVGLAALLPLALAGATVLPYREVLAIARRLILI